MHANSSENRLTHLLGVYNSDSDDEENEEKEVQEKHGNNGAAEVADNIVQTDWTQCYDRETGKPYFFNTSSNQHQWEMPEDYRLYLEWVRRNKFSETEQKWKVYEAEDSGVPYYVNEVTRIVSWEMPEGYRKHLESQKKEQMRKKSVKPTNKIQKKPPKKYPEHLLNHDSDEDKIELISSYSRSSDSEDEDVASKRTEKTSKSDKSPDQIPNEELLPYKMYTQDSNTDPQSMEKSSNQPSSILFSNETSVTLSELEKTYLSSRKSSKSPENIIQPETNKSIPTIGEEIDAKLMMRKRRIEIPRIPQKIEPQPKVEVDEELQSKAKTGLYANFQSGGVEFADQSEKKEEVVEVKEEKKELKDASTSTAEDDETGEEDVKELSTLIGAKVKFLSEGRPIVSGVQIMQIQLETLVAAFEAQQLTRFYVMNWLNSTAKSLMQLENDVAPNGWKCKWDRTNSRYYYQSLVTGKIQWDFPEPDVTCHGDEMEICTTPPHPGVEDEEPEAKKLKQEDKEGDDSQEPRTPEPPTWDSSPEPPPAPSFDAAPPPPRITDKFHSELDSFYSDLASLETTANPTEEPVAEVVPVPEVQKTTKPEELPAQPVAAVKVKKKKVKTSRTEMKEMSQLMAKWQKAQQDLKK
ncbi:formin-binding protein 4-like isoform X2 [Phlebotomus papatasi]|uniref:formin-binding protein 4-like isoform X2 n=1 Tax=Phlebotomus papatasi TaxID=29031 RepID=UPI002483BC0F|nr:formin-binding protein 4-like isoform X2 [Phlebotomus papatasi]